MENKPARDIKIGDILQDGTTMVFVVDKTDDRIITQNRTLADFANNTNLSPPTTEYQYQSNDNNDFPFPILVDEESTKLTNKSSSALKGYQNRYASQNPDAAERYKQQEIRLGNLPSPEQDEIMLRWQQHYVVPLIDQLILSFPNFRALKNMRNEAAKGEMDYFPPLATGHYKSFRSGLYPIPDQAVLDATSLAAKTATPEIMTWGPDWFFRGAKSGNRSGEVKERYSFNVGASPDLIHDLDQFIQSKNVQYKVPNSSNINEWSERHDPVTLYCYEALTDAEIQELIKVVDPYIRKTSPNINVGIGEKCADGVFKYVGGDPDKQQTQALLARAKALHPKLVQMVSTSDGIMSAGYYEVAIKAIEAFEKEKLKYEQELAAAGPAPQPDETDEAAPLKTIQAKPEAVEPPPTTDATVSVTPAEPKAKEKIIKFAKTRDLVTTEINATDPDEWRRQIINKAVPAIMKNVNGILTDLIEAVDKEEPDKNEQLGLKTRLGAQQPTYVFFRAFDWSLLEDGKATTEHKDNIVKFIKEKYKAKGTELDESQIRIDDKGVCISGLRFDDHGQINYDESKFTRDSFNDVSINDEDLKNDLLKNLPWKKDTKGKTVEILTNAFMPKPDWENNRQFHIGYAAEALPQLVPDINYAVVLADYIEKNGEKDYKYLSRFEVNDKGFECSFYNPAGAEKEKNLGSYSVTHDHSHTASTMNEVVLDAMICGIKNDQAKNKNIWRDGATVESENLENFLITVAALKVEDIKLDEETEAKFNKLCPDEDSLEKFEGLKEKYKARRHGKTAPAPDARSAATPTPS